MNLRFLRTFVAIADHAGFARAATQLNLTQSAASRQIQALEAELGPPGQPRLDRHADGLGDRFRATPKPASRSPLTGTLATAAICRMRANISSRDTARGVAITW
jgi:hypothetical protein